MSPIFIKEFKSKNPCARCKEKAVKGKRFCDSHLTSARLEWRVWSAERRIAGFCITCNWKAVSGNLRCRKHRKLNAANCKQWYYNHIDERTQYDRNHKEAWIRQGLCRCTEHNPLVPGGRRCQTCRDYSRALDSNNYQVLDQIRQRRRMKKIAKGLALGQKARVELTPVPQ